MKVYEENRKTALFYEINILIITIKFDVAKGCFDGEKINELIEFLLLQQIKDKMSELMIHRGN